ncbi:MAG TPA: glycosyltransferase family 4 protein [Solirubrobacteraceae bacterium]|nr:glycosyltransferase family 4 protein [Solirubrobacteraceae bacterium]
MRVDLVDPPAFTPPYDHALAAALAAEGARTTLVTSRFGYGPVAAARGYAVDERFYRLQPGAPGSRLRRAARLAQHVPDMVAYRVTAPRRADVVHLQWLTVQPLDVHLLPRGLRATVLTAHDVLPREPRRGQLDAQRRLLERVDGVVVHSQHGRERLIGELGFDPGRVHVVPHGAFEHLTAVPDEQPLPRELRAIADERPVVLCFGLLRPYKGLDVLLDAWRGIENAELWIVGMPRMDTTALRAAAPPGVRWYRRFVPDAQLAAFFRRADLVVLPYREIDQSGVLFTALAFARPMVLSAVGGFPEVARTGAAALVAPGDPAALHARLRALLADRAERERLGAAARAAATGPYGWDTIARRTLALYRDLAEP